MITAQLSNEFDTIFELQNLVLQRCHTPRPALNMTLQSLRTELRKYVQRTVVFLDPPLRIQ